VRCSDEYMEACKLPQEELGRDRKNRYKDFLRTESDRRMHLEYQLEGIEARPEDSSERALN